MVSYLIFLNILILAIAGMTYMMSSDIVDIILPVGAGLGNTHPDTDIVRDILLFGFKFLPVWIVIGLILFDYTMAQKPEHPY